MQQEFNVILRLDLSVHCSIGISMQFDSLNEAQRCDIIIICNLLEILPSDKKCTLSVDHEISH